MGRFFLHILRDPSRDVRKRVNPNDDSPVVLLRAMRTAIQKRFDEASDNPDHFRKIAWFVDYWNNSINTGIEGLEAIATRPL